MKKAAIALVISVLLVANTLASPQVFKIKKEIDSPDIGAELFTLDTAKFHKLRIFIDWSPSGSLKNPVYTLAVVAVEGDEYVVIHGQTVDLRNPIRANILIDVPPSKIRVTIAGQGNFRAFVWAQ